MKKTFLIMGVILTLLMFYTFYVFQAEEPNELPYYEFINVEIGGAVTFPGSYEVCESTLLVDLISYAGGFHSNANKTNVNLTEHLINGTRYYIPFLNEQDVVKGLININTATKEELTTLPNIGDAKAIAIINYRNEYGLFENIEEIKNVSGIGEKVYESIKEKITV